MTAVTKRRPVNTRRLAPVCKQMQSHKLSRRRMLLRLGLTAATGTVGGALPASAAEPPPPRPGPAPMALNVQDFGAAEGGKSRPPVEDQ